MPPLHRSLIAALSLLPSLSALAQLGITAVGVPVTLDFDVAGTPHCSNALTWTDDTTIPHCYSDRSSYNYSDGCANTGGLHIAGVNGETALGGRSSNSTSSLRWGVRFKNNSGVPLSGLRVRVRSEQWGHAVSDQQNIVRFGYRSSTTPITDVITGTYVNLAGLDLTNFTAPSGCSGSNSAIDGNSSAHSALLEACVPVALQPGDEIMFRWHDVNDPCNDHMLCVDDLDVTGLPFPAITLAGPAQVCEGSSVTLTVEHADAVQWNTGDSGPTLAVTEAGTYTATCTTPCGTIVTLTQEVTVMDAPTITLAPDDALLCPGATLTLTATANAGELLWSTGETSTSINVIVPGPYSVTTTSACGSAQASLLVAAGEAPTAHITTTAGTTLCAGTSTTLSATGGPSYVWSNGDTGADLIVDEAGTWTVTTTNACGSAQASITLTAIATPILGVHASALVICADGSVTLNATGNGPFLWSTGETVANINTTQPGQYTVTSTNACGSASESVSIADGRFEASFTATPVQGLAPLLVNAAASTGGGLDLNWDLDNGEASTEPAVSPTYTRPGQYTIALTATDPTTGCQASTSTLIEVLPGLSWVRMPTVFTPNGDGINEGLRAEHEALASLECYILNRWGQEVARLQHPADVWNGRDASGTVADGTYYYVLHARGTDGREHTLQGSFTLLR